MTAGASPAFQRKYFFSGLAIGRKLKLFAGFWSSWLYGRKNSKKFEHGPKIPTCSLTFNCISHCARQKMPLQTTISSRSTLGKDWSQYQIWMQK